MNLVETEAVLWQNIEQVAHTAGLDPQKFGQPHREILREILTTLALPEPVPSTDPRSPRKKWRHLLLDKLPASLRVAELAEPEPPRYVPPIIIAGEPGTGKTTFLAVLDVVLRHSLGLPDNIAPQMHNDHGRVLAVHKRTLNGLPISLLSVRKWSELLHFYAWDITQHRLDTAAMNHFIRQTLQPMRVLFADEVEMYGYAPTIPDLAKHGLLVVGTSNQYAFQQLAQEHIYRFGGLDMRAGNPAEAVVTAVHPAWDIFEQVAQQPTQTFERLVYQQQQIGARHYVRVDFWQAVQAPLLEREWMHFLTTAVADPTTLTLLLDQFSLQQLRTDYSAIIRFVTLFDVIEQLAVGVLVRHTAVSATLSREALTHMKVTIESARGVTEEIKRKTVVGIDRCASRIGQAGHRAVGELPAISCQS